MSDTAANAAIEQAGREVRLGLEALAHAVLVYAAVEACANHNPTSDYINTFIEHVQRRGR